MKTHIDILDDDVLLLIFDFVFERPSPKGDFCNGDRPLACLHLNREIWRVCRRWASVLLPWPPAWSHIIKPSDFIRCGQGELDVYLDQTDQELLVLDAVVGCKERIRQVHFLFDLKPYLPLDMSSHMMVSLTLMVWRGKAMDMGWLSENGLPRLKKLRTIGMDVGVLRFRLLTHLCLEDGFINKGEIVEMLGMNVGLQELILCDMRWRDESEVDSAVVVEMTKLKWLRLSWGVASLTENLKIGGKVAVRVQGMRYVSLEFPRSEGPAFEKLRIRRSYSTAYITALNEERFVQYEVADPQNLYGLVGDRMLFRFVQELWIVEKQVFVWSRIENWEMILESMEGLARMFVEGNDCEYVIAPLSGLNRESKDVVCPKLKELRLTETLLHMDRLLEIARLRNEKGRRLKMLELRWVLIKDEETINAMREYVDEVRVGGTMEDWRMSVGKKFFEHRHDLWKELGGVDRYGNVSRFRS